MIWMLLSKNAGPLGGHVPCQIPRTDAWKGSRASEKKTCPTAAARVHAGLLYFNLPRKNEDPKDRASQCVAKA